MTVKPRTKPSHKCMPKASVYKLIAGGESITFLIILVVFFGVLGNKMGAANMVNTIMNTAYELLIGTVFYIMAWRLLCWPALLLV